MTTQVFVAKTIHSFPQVLAIITGAFESIADVLKRVDGTADKCQCHELMQTTSTDKVQLACVNGQLQIWPASGCAVGAKISCYKKGQPFVLIRNTMQQFYEPEHFIPVGYAPSVVLQESLTFCEKPVNVPLPACNVIKNYRAESSILFNFALIAYWNKAEERRQQRVLSQVPDEIYSRFTNMNNWKQALRGDDIAKRKQAAKILTTFESLGILAHCKVTCMVNAQPNVRDFVLVPARGSFYSAFQLQDVCINTAEVLTCPLLVLALTRFVLNSKSLVCTNLASIIGGMDAELNMMVFLAKNNQNCFCLFICVPTGMPREDGQYLSYLIFDKVIDGVPALIHAYEVVDVVSLRFYELLRPTLARQQGFQFLDMAVSYARSIQHENDFETQFQLFADEQQFARTFAQILDTDSRLSAYSSLVTLARKMNIRELMALAGELPDALLVALVHCLDCSDSFVAQYFRTILAELDYLVLQRAAPAIVAVSAQLAKFTALIAVQSQPMDFFGALMAVYQAFEHVGVHQSEICGISLPAVLRWCHRRVFTLVQSHSNFLFVNKYPKTVQDAYFLLLQEYQVIPSAPQALGQGETTAVVVYADLRDDPAASTLTVVTQETLETPAFDDALREYVEIPQSMQEHMIITRKQPLQFIDVYVANGNIATHPVTLVYTATIAAVKRIIHQVTLVFTSKSQFSAFHRALSASLYYILNSQHSTFNNFLGLCSKVQIDCICRGKVTPLERFSFEQETIRANMVAEPLLNTTDFDSVAAFFDHLVHTALFSRIDTYSNELRQVCAARVEINQFLTAYNDNNGQCMLDCMYQELFEREQRFFAAYTGSKELVDSNLATPLHKQLDVHCCAAMLLGQGISFGQARAILRKCQLRPSNVALACSAIEISEQDMSCFDDS